MPKPNVELLDRTMAEVEKAARRKRRTWDQGTYRRVTDCGTAMCFAGWALTLDGAKWADEVTDDHVDSWSVVARRGEPLDMRTSEGVRLAFAPVAAQKRLGLTDPEADHLFAGDNTLADLRRIVSEIKERAAKKSVPR